MIPSASNLTLGQLRQAFGVQLNSHDHFFVDWLKNAPPLTDLEQVGVDRLCRNYLYLSQEEPPLEEIVKLVVVSPLLDLAGFYQAPFFVRTEVGTSLQIADEPNTVPIQGRIDILVVQSSFWVIVIESKPARLDVTAGIPQALTYLLSSPTSQTTVYGLVTNGREVIFLKLDRSSGLPEYLRSATYRLLENREERSQVLQGLKQIGAYLVTT